MQLSKVNLVAENNNSNNNNNGNGILSSRIPKCCKCIWQ
jgi:hypothetical protein